MAALETFMSTVHIGLLNSSGGFEQVQLSEL